jgi:hypothetical protein
MSQTHSMFKDYYPTDLKGEIPKGSSPYKALAFMYLF